MAFGIHTINKHYSPNGSGRDWFFVGDFEYRNGRRTPQPNSGGLKPVPPPTRKKGPPFEVLHGRARAAAAKKPLKQRWAEVQLSQSSPALLVLDSPSKAQPLELKFMDMRQMPGSRAAEDALAGVPTGATEYEKGAKSGDHTRGIRGPTPHFAATSWNYSGPQGWEGKRQEVDFIEDLVRAGVREAPQGDSNKLQEGDYTRTIRGKVPHHKSTMSDLGMIPGWNQEAYGSPHKHMYHAASVFPDRHLEEAGGTLPGVMHKEPGPGDQCRGVKGKIPHFFPTSWDLGSIPNWQKQKYDFGPVAHSELRLTMWGSNRDGR